jgi:hypothetical protein
VETARWERIGAICGIVFVVLVLISFFTPSTPAIDDPIGEAIAEIADDETGILLGIYVGGLSAIAFLPFLGALWRLLRRRDAAGVVSAALLAGGIITVAGVLAAGGVGAALVEAVDEGYGNEAVSALIALDNTLFLGTVFSFAAFYAAAGVAILLHGGLPRWLGWVAVAIAIVMVVGMLGLFSESDDGGALGVLVFIGLLVGLAWTLATSIVMLVQGRPQPPSTPPPKPLGSP